MTYATLIQHLVEEWHRPVTVTEAARILGIPGRTPGGKAQRLRRLEREGVLPPAHRSLVHQDRYWFRAELVELRAIREERREMGQQAW